jgi:hypothetical protein
VRALTVAPLLVPLCVSTLGCGSAQAPAAVASGVPVTKASAVAFARAVNVRAGDLSGMEAVGIEHSAPNSGIAAFRFAECAGGISPARIVADVRSVLLWTSTNLQWRGIQSHVAVMPSEALARRNLVASTSRRGLRCERSRGDTSVSPIRMVLPGGAHVAGSRIALSQGGSGHRLDYKDFLRFVAGPAEVVLVAAGSAHPVARGTERELLGVLYRRAIAARGEL